MHRHSSSGAFFFFFQAEDGIRDVAVTGVQTCALPISFLPEYVPRKRFLTREELCRLLASQTRDHAAQVAFMVATSAEWGAVMRARREDVSEDLAFVRIRGTKRKTRDRVVPIVTKDQRTLLKYALEHAQGEKGQLFLDWQNVRRDLRAACAK